MKRVIAFAFIFITSSTLAEMVFWVPDDYPTIQEAVDHIGYPDDVIVLAPGIYTGEGNINVIINCRYDLMITGQTSWQDVIIDAEGQGRIFTITSESDLTPVVTLENMTLQNAWIDDNSIGGAVSCKDVHLTVASCLFQNNIQASETHTPGGAIGCDQSDFLVCTNSVFLNNNSAGSSGAIVADRAFIDHCLFRDNRALNGGALSCFNSLFLSESEFYTNQAENSGGAVSVCGYCSISKCVFEGNEAMESKGGAISASELYKIDINGSRFIQNKSAGSGGAFLCNGSLMGEINNCLFFGNQSTEYDAGAITINTYSLEMTNCTFIANQSANTGAACVFYSNDNTKVTNCIFWDNQSVDGIDIYCRTFEATQSPTHVFIDHSVIEPDSWYCDPDSTFTLAEGVIFSDPLLADIAGGDYRLTSGSPCIDNGSPATLFETDIDGNPRPVGAGFDIGVSEYQTVYSPGAHLFMADTALAPGDPFQLDVLSVCGPEASAADLVVMLEVHGNYFFHPNWEMDFQPEQLNLDYGRQKETILDFTWPSGVAPDWGWTFWAALLEPGETVLIGEVDRVSFDIQP